LIIYVVNEKSLQGQCTNITEARSMKQC